jgi:hypothetical protein
MVEAAGLMRLIQPAAPPRLGDFIKVLAPLREKVHPPSPHIVHTTIFVTRIAACLWFFTSHFLQFRLQRSMMNSLHSADLISLSFLLLGRKDEKSNLIHSKWKTTAHHG